jgi:hypothetical protein
MSEHNPEGLLVRGFLHELSIYDKLTGELVSYEVKFNRIPQAGLDFLIQAPFGDVAQIPNFYCCLFKNDYVPSAATSAADLPSVMGEFVDYSEATRPVWTRGYDGAGTLNNAAAKAVFTPTADASVYGSCIVSNPVKGSNSGLVISAVRFSTIKPLSAGLEAKLVCGLTYIPTNAI